MDICPKLNVTAWLQFELTHFEATRTPMACIVVEWKIGEVHLKSLYFLIKREKRRGGVQF